MTDLEALRTRWIAERPLYEELAQHIRKLLIDATRENGIICDVTCRAKEVSQLLKKALRKNYESPYDEIKDKAGVRVTAAYQDFVPAIDSIIRDSFKILHYENKSEQLEFDQLGYLGIHFEAVLPYEQLRGEAVRYRDLIFEIQLHTRAQNLWAEVSHQLSYKSPKTPSAQVQRSIYRLMALVEIFDEQVSSARRAIMTTAGYQEAQVLDSLEKHFYKLTAREFDRELSLDIISKLQGLFGNSELTGFESLIDRFVETHHEKLVLIFEGYADDDRSNPLLFQPESLLILERWEKDSFKLREVWREMLPLSLLDSLETIWGRSI